jgi:PIN domain nuclease of toxin-antitoxin system
MKLLLDTQCFLHIFLDPGRLSQRALDVLTNEASDLYFSAASAWEIAIKFSIGKLYLPEPPETYVVKRMREYEVTPLPVEHAHALHVCTLPHIHKDPFDRLLIAQARVAGLTLMTTDAVIAQYPVECVLAGNRVNGSV